MRIAVIVVILVVAAVVMVVLARRRRITDLSTQETHTAPPKRDRPAGPEAESMDPDDFGGDHTRERPGS